VPPDPDHLAALTKIPFFKVAAAENFNATVQPAVALTGPTLVEVDMTAISNYGWQAGVDGWSH